MSRDHPTCAQCGNPAQSKHALCSPCERFLARKAHEAQQKKDKGK